MSSAQRFPHHNDAVNWLVENYNITRENAHWWVVEHSFQMGTDPATWLTVFPQPPSSLEDDEYTALYSTFDR